MLEKKYDKSVARWLFIMILMVCAIIIVGGATRLTNSGLSITEWKPITGALPPLSHADWLSEFEKYKQIPEFLAEHPDMDLEGFKFIYFWEWGHRQIGRMIGLVYALPFLFFLLRGRLPKAKTWRFATILVLIGVQGAIGWWMVHSGLGNDRVDVAPYRLATHLGIAFIILGLLYWLWRDVRENWPAKNSDPGFAGLSKLLLGAVFLQIIAGAFVAGTRSGKTYNTWPLMDGGFVPEGYFVMSPLWHNFGENGATVQFNHRILAYILTALVIGLFVKAIREKRLVKEMGHMFGITLWQVGLGIWTLLAVAPLNLSLLHQFSSILVFICALWVMREATYRKDSL